jgi:hypothetical protein
MKKRMSTMSDEMTARSAEEGQSLDLVQRVVISALVAVVMGLFSGVLALYLAARGAQDLARGDVIGLWLMTGVLGLLTAGAILLINRRRPYHPLLLVGLLPMAASAYWIFTG